MRVNLEGSARGDEEMELRDMLDGYLMILCREFTHYWRTRMGGSMAKYESRGRFKDGNLSSKSMTETRFAPISCW